MGTPARVGAGGPRERGDRRQRAGSGGGQTAPSGARPLRRLRAPVPRLRPWGGPTSLADAGPRHDDRLAGGRRTEGALPYARRRRLRRALGAPRLAFHLALRAAGRLAGDQHLRQRRRRADAGQLAQRGPDLRAGSGGGRPRRGPAGRPSADRDRRDLPPQGPPLPDRGRRPRHRKAGLGGAGARQGDSGGVLRHAGRSAPRR